MYTEPVQQVVVFANGAFALPEEPSCRPGSGDVVICADGGARHALALNIMPAIVVGDFDSLDTETIARLQQGGAELRRYPCDKERCDLELALEIALTYHPEQILLLGALGGRLDHLLANLLLCARPETGAVRFLIAEGATRAVILHGGQTASLNGIAGDAISVIPLTSEALVSISGVRWPLCRAPIVFGSTRTISNEFTDTAAQVMVESGSVVVIHTRS